MGSQEYFLSVSPPCCFFDGRSGGGEEPSGAKCPPPDSDPLTAHSLEKIWSARQAQFAASTSRRFEFDKRSQLFIRVVNGRIIRHPAIKNDSTTLWSRLCARVFQSRCQRHRKRGSRQLFKC